MCLDEELLASFDLHEDDLNTDVTENDIAKISSFSCEKWRSLYSYLGLRKIHVKDAERDGHDEEERRYKFFQTWKSKKGPGATFRSLVHALLLMECRQDAEDVCQLLADRLVPSSNNQREAVRGNAYLANRHVSQLPVVQLNDMTFPNGASNKKLIWRRGPDLPFAMTNNAQSVMVKGTLYMGGGVSVVGSVQNFIVVKFAAYSGVMKKLKPYSTLYFAMVAVKDQLVLVGGAERDGKVSQKLGAWDANQKKWTYPYPDMTTPRSGCSAVVYKEWLIVAGGLTVAKEPRSQASIMLELKRYYAMTSSVEVLNTKTMQWYTVPDAPKPMYCTKTVSVGNYGYFMGGADKSGAPFAKIYLIDFDALISYINSNDSNSQVWKEICGPTQRDPEDKERIELVGLSPFSIKGSLYVAGGWNEKRGKSVTDIFCYQPGKKKWMKVGDMLYPRYYCTSAMISENEMFVAMGENSPFQQPKTTYYARMSYKLSTTSSSFIATQHTSVFDILLILLATIILLCPFYQSYLPYLSLCLVFLILLCSHVLY